MVPCPFLFSSFTFDRSHPHHATLCSRSMQRQACLPRCCIASACRSLESFGNLRHRSQLSLILVLHAHHSTAMNTQQQQQQPQSRQRGASRLLAAAAVIGTAQAFLLPFNTPAQPQASLAKSSGLWWQQQQQQAGVRTDRRRRTREEGGREATSPRKYLACKGCCTPPSHFGSCLLCDVCTF